MKAAKAYTESGSNVQYDQQSLISRDASGVSPETTFWSWNDQYLLFTGYAPINRKS